MGARHFLTLADLSGSELLTLLRHAIAGKKAYATHGPSDILRGKSLAMIFEKASTRTRISFEVGMAQLGGQAIYLSPQGTQIGRGEPLDDVARVLSRMVDGIMLRTYAHADIQRLAAYADVPVINGLCDTHHPCQLLADLQTYLEQRGSITGKQVTWVGDGNNMCHSYIQAAKLLDFKLHIASPEGYLPQSAWLAFADGHAELYADPTEAVIGADLVVTDVWASMGQEQEQVARQKIFADYQVNSALMALAHKEALFMHCLPAHRGEEVTAEVIDGAQSVVWEEAGNRLHAQKALLELLLAN